METSQAPEGWYPDPADVSGQRWWDGTQWTAYQRAGSDLAGPVPAGVRSVADGYSPATRASAAQGAPNPDPAMKWILPVGRSGLAIAAGYLGLFSLVGVFAPVSVVVSILALRDLKEHPARLGRGRAIFGLVMGILFTLLMAIGIAGELAQ